MKKILNIALLLLSVVLLVGCGDDDKDSVYGDGLEIVRVKDINFKAEGGLGTITVSVENPKVEVDADWCTFSVEGKVITVNTTANATVSSRNASVLISDANGNSKRVSVNQLGSVFQYTIDKTRFSLSGGTATMKVLESNLPYTIEASEGLNYTKLNDSIIVFDVAPSSSLRVLNAKFIIGDGARQLNLALNQDILRYEDLLGNWELTYINKLGVPSTTQLTFAQKVEGQSYTMSGFVIISTKYNVEMIFDPTTGTVKPTPGAYLGRLGAGYVGLVMKSETAFSLNGQYVGAINVSLSNTGIVYDFSDPTSTGNTGLTLGKFSTNSPSILMANFQGEQSSYLNMRMKKL